MNEEMNDPSSSEERQKLAASKRGHFAAVRPEAAAEYDADPKWCLNCKWLSDECHKTCGVIMKHVARKNGHCP